MAQTEDMPMLDGTDHIDVKVKAAVLGSAGPLMLGDQFRVEIRGTVTKAGVERKKGADIPFAEVTADEVRPLDPGSRP